MKLQEFTSSRILWFLILFICISGLSVALVAEHYFNMLPCYLCIYQRIALLIIALFSSFTLLNPSNHIFRKIGYFGFFLGSGLGLYSAIKLVYLQANPPEISFCSMGANQLIETFGWLEALPLLFNPSGDCGKSAGSFFGVTFEQWTLALFLLMISIFIFIISIRFLQRLKS